MLSYQHAIADTKFNIYEYQYQVPDKYHPVIDNGVFTFYLDFPNSELSLKKVGPTPDNNLRIRVEHKNIRSRYTTKNIINDGKFIYKKYQFGDKKYEFDVYKEYFGKNSQTEVTSYLSTINSEPVVIRQAGDLNPRIYRSAGKSRELDYVYSKELSIQDWLKLDKFIMKTLASFESQSK